MKQTDFDGIHFLQSLHDGDAIHTAGHIIHILCRHGNMSFTQHHTHYNIQPGDYVILPDGAHASDFTSGKDFDGIIMVLSEAYVSSIAIRSNYGIIGHLSLMQNPVMQLSPRDYDLCERALAYLRERMGDTCHLFRDELLGSLLTAHILDLYDIHARRRCASPVPQQTALILRRFIEMLYLGDFATHRDLPYYASRLCITPHYLSELCRKISGQPATYWIDRFTIDETARLLRRKELSLTDIAERLNFSSVSYFSRYVTKHLGMTPSAYRKQL